MNRSKHPLFERLIVLAFPVAVFAGCAGNGDVKPETTGFQSENISTPLQSTEHNSNDNTSVTFAVDPTPEITLSNKNENQVPQTTTEQAPVTTLPVSNIYYFDTDKSDIHREDLDQLKQHSGYLLANPDITLVINGHADERGTQKYNQGLSEKRADKVYQLLLSLGVPEHQLMTKGHGEEQPLSNINRWDENRRVELDYINSVQVSVK